MSKTLLMKLGAASLAVFLLGACATQEEDTNEGNNNQEQQEDTGEEQMNFDDGDGMNNQDGNMNNQNGNMNGGNGPDIDMNEDMEGKGNNDDMTNEDTMERDRLNGGNNE